MPQNVFVGAAGSIAVAQSAAREARADAEEDKFTDKVGTQFVSTVYHGKAIYQSAGEPAEVRFICLHGGLGKGAVFVYTLPR